MLSFSRAAGEKNMAAKNMAAHDGCEEYKNSGQNMAAHDADLHAQLSVANSLLSAMKERHQMKVTARRELEQQTTALQQVADESARRIGLLAEAEAACLQRLSLSRSLLGEAGQKLEGLRTRGAVAEEILRERTIRLGGLSERLLERKQQHRTLIQRVLEQRLRVGLLTWLRPHQLETALDRWGDTLQKRARNVERLRGATVLWRLSALHHGFAAWRAGARPQALARATAARVNRQQSAHQHLDRAIELRKR